MPHENDPDSSNSGDQQKSAEEQLGNMVNAAVSAHLKRFTEKQLPTILESALKPLADKIAAVPPPSVEDEGKKKNKNQDPELLAMAKQMEDLKKELVARDEKVAAAERAAREQRAYTELRGALDGKVRGDVVDFVAKYLMQVEGRVDFDEAGNVLFKSQRAPFTGADPEEIRLPLKSGIDDFLKSDAAKPFLPAPSTNGASPLPKRGAPTVGADFSKPATTDAEKARRAAERARQIEERLGKQ